MICLGHIDVSLMHTNDNSSTHQWYVLRTLMLNLLHAKDKSSTH